MSNPWADLTETQRRQIREAHAAAKLDQPVEAHEVTALYDNNRITREGRNSPTLDCSCGKSFSADFWEEAGRDMDEHLEEVGGRD